MEDFLCRIFSATGITETKTQGRKEDVNDKEKVYEREGMNGKIEVKRGKEAQLVKNEKVKN